MREEYAECIKLMDSEKNKGYYDSVLRDIPPTAACTPYFGKVSLTSIVFLSILKLLASGHFFRLLFEPAANVGGSARPVAGGCDQFPKENGGPFHCLQGAQVDQERIHLRSQSGHSEAHQDLEGLVR